MYTVTAIDPLGCVGSETVLVGIDPLAKLSLTLTGSTGTICGGQSDTLAVAGANSYSWAPLTNLVKINLSQDTAIFNPIVTTIYSVTGSNNKGCFGTANFTVTVVSQPTPVVTPSLAILCPGFNTTLTAFGANTYTWYGMTFSTGIAQQSVAVGPGTYTVVSSNGGTCIHPGYTVNVLQQTNVPPVNVSQSTQTTCIESNNPKFSKPVKLTASNYQNYVWFPYNPCCMTYSLGASTVVRPPASTSYTVFGYSSTCSNSNVITVKVEPQFTMNVTPPLPVMCIGDTLKLAINNPGPGAGSNKGPVGPASAFTYSWTEADNAPRISINSEFTPTVLIWPKNTTTYTVEMYDSRGCASLPRLMTVTVLPRPETAVAIPTINSIPTNTVCFVGLFPGPTDNIINLTAVNKNLILPTGIIPTYTWTSPNNSILTPINNPYVTVNAPNRTPELITYTVNSGYNGVPGCKRIDTVSIRVIDCRPVYKASFSTTDHVDTVCAMTCITFVNNTDTMAGGPQKLTWTFDGGTPRTSTLQVPTVCYNLKGSWSVMLKVENPFPREKSDGSAPGSTVTTGKLNVINVTNTPNVTITKPGQMHGDTTIRFGQSVTMSATGASWYEWSPSYNISSLNSDNVTVRPFKTTQYIVTGFNSRSCFSADTMNVIVIDDCGEMFVPTAFSPNGDGHNDVLKVNGICLQTMVFMIFNRWGEKVFETSDQSVGWDGTFRGVDLNSGVFVYRLEGKTFDGKGFTSKGNITLIR